MILKNCIKVSFRNLGKQKLFSIISISSLAVGMAVFIFFLQLFRAPFAMDTFHRDAERIYTLVEVFPGGNRGDRHEAFTPLPLPAALENEVAEIEAVTRICGTGRCYLGSQDQGFPEDSGLAVDPNFFSFFSFRVLSGDPEAMFSRPDSIVLTESMAAKYFGTKPARGQVLTLDRQVDLTVTGIVADPPPQSSIRYAFLLPFAAVSGLSSRPDDWTTSRVSSFVRLPAGYDPALLEGKLDAFRKNHFPPAATAPSKIYLYPLAGLFFRPDYLQAGFDHDSKPGYYIALAMGILFLGVVCVNYMNLVTARYADRMKEVGIRKSIGASRRHLVQQFLGESVFFTLLALPAALALYQCYYPWLGQILGNRVELSVWKSPGTIFLLTGVAILVGLFSGSYPALFLSRFRPVQTLKGKLEPGSRGRLRKTLVVFQFSLSIIFIIFALTVKKQSDYAFQMNPGYDGKNIVAVSIPEEARKNLPLLTAGLKQNSAVASLAGSVRIPGGWRVAESTVVPEGAAGTAALQMYAYGVQGDFINVMGMKIKAGRAFSPEQNEEHGFIVNGLAAARLGGGNPVGKTITLGTRRGTIIGVVGDIFMNSMQSPNAPAILYLEPDKLSALLIKVTGAAQIPDVKASLLTLWKKINPDVPCEAFTLDEYLVIRESSRQKVSVFLGAIGAAAIFFSALGLFGLVSYAVRQRTKEIGVRKVLGASTPEIAALLARGFLFLMILANLIGLPVAFYLSHLFLTGLFPIRTSPGPGIFIFVSSLTFLTAVAALAFQVVKGARANPVESLRFE